MLAPMNAMKRNVWLLSGCQALMNSGNSLLIATSALVGYRLAADKSLATLPLALQFLTSMLTTIPASFLMKAIGRRAGFVVGTLLGLARRGARRLGHRRRKFSLFLRRGSVHWRPQRIRYVLPLRRRRRGRRRLPQPRHLYVMAGGVVAAFIGPNLAHWTSDWLSGIEFAGSYLSLLGIYGLSLVVLLFVRIPPPTAAQAHAHGRPLSVIARQPVFIVALAGGALGFGADGAGHDCHPAGHAPARACVRRHRVRDRVAPARHVRAVIFTGHLIRRFGVLNVMLAGVVLNIGCVAVNLAGTEVAHFWAALTLLGVGWNFLFIGGTTLLTETYTESEKAKAQALNDFLVFTVITAASLSAGRCSIISALACGEPWRRATHYRDFGGDPVAAAGASDAGAGVGRNGRRRLRPTARFPYFSRLQEMVAGDGMNRRHADFQSAALPTELPGRYEKAAH